MYFFLFSMEKFLSQQRIIDFHCITLSSSILSSHIRPNESSGLSIFPDRLFPFYVKVHVEFPTNSLPVAPPIRNSLLREISLK